LLRPRMRLLWWCCWPFLMACCSTTPVAVFATHFSLDRRRAGTQFRRSPRQPGGAPTSCAFRRRSGRCCP